MKVRVDVNLRAGVLDPQGKAVSHALTMMGFKNVGEVRIGRTIEVDMSEEDPARAVTQATEMAQKLLANTVIEDYRVSIVQ